jgi:hypothetical protein
MNKEIEELIDNANNGVYCDENTGIYHIPEHYSSDSEEYYHVFLKNSIVMEKVNNELQQMYNQYNRLKDTSDFYINLNMVNVCINLIQNIYSHCEEKKINTINIPHISFFERDTIVIEWKFKNMNIVLNICNDTTDILYYMKINDEKPIAKHITKEKMYFWMKTFINVFEIYICA